MDWSARKADRNFSERLALGDIAAFPGVENPEAEALFFLIERALQFCDWLFLAVICKAKCTEVNSNAC
jgi:hypothetical protein